MKKLITVLISILFFTTLSISLFAVAEEQPKSDKPAKEKVKVDVQHVFGEITKLDLENYTVTIKQEDGTEITIKATTEKTQEMIKNLKVGDKVKAGYIKTKEGDLVLIKIVKPEGKQKDKKEQPKEKSPKK